MSMENDLEGYAEIADSLRERREEDRKLLYEQLVLEGLTFAAKFRYKDEGVNPKVNYDSEGRYIDPNW